MDLQQSLPYAKAVWQRDHRRAWIISIGVAAIGIFILAGLFWETAASAVKLWWERSTYNYAFLILPISSYLVWRKREEVQVETPVGSLWGVGIVAVFGVLWLVSDIAEVNEGRHIAFVGMILGILLACLGWRLFKILSFPFLYLLLLAPAGTPLLPPLQRIATHISSAIVRWFGIPIYVEGFFIEAPSGIYHIEPGCAGLNFLLATAALAPLYAYLLYSSQWKRLIVVVLAFLLAIIMNGVRIAGIIVLAHWGGPKLNIAEDHLFYGWLFFALVFFVAGYAGSFFADHESETSIDTMPRIPSYNVEQTPWRAALTGSLSLLVIVLVFLLANGLMAASSRSEALSQEPLQIQGWSNVSSSSDWTPAFPRGASQVRQRFTRDGETVDFFIAEYPIQAKGLETIAYDNSVFDQAGSAIVHQRQRTIDIGSKTLPFVELEAASNEGRCLWQFYWVDGTFTADPFIAKLLIIKAKLFFGDQRTATVGIATRGPGCRGDAERRLQSFVKEALPSIETTLTHAGRPALQVQ